MHVHMTGEMIEALKATPEMPEDLTAAVEAAKDHDERGYVVELSDDEAMAMIEMCQWYIHTDPTTGEMGSKAQLFQSIVDAIDAAQVA